MNKNFKINDEVLYTGIEMESIKLFNNKVYTVSDVKLGGAIVLSEVETERQVSWNPSQFKLAPRKMKFSSKPGSAVVYYKSGAEFHISRLTCIELGYVNGETCISIERDYFQDGIYFAEAACIPVDMFDKLVYVTKEHDVVNDLVTVTYNPEIKYLVRDVSNKFLRLDME